ncbi:MAG: motility associated factor glycosyltransferase family protein, partial [Campylobacterales bacterium]|nr:motility associated factor glycosyltransferase family protein [Campylobacterales bacterium]
SLEYTNGYFNILNEENKEYYYFFNSYDDADIRKDHIDFSLQSSLNLLRKDPATGKLIFSDLYQEIMPIIHFINENVDMDNVNFKKIYKFVFIGTGLGFHMHEINKKLDPYTTLIIEPDLEIFRLSLFTIDYTVFNEGNKQLFLSIGNDKNERTATIHNFAHHYGYMNYNIKHYNYLKSNQYIKEELIDYFGSNSVTYFPYKAIVQILRRTIFLMKQEEKFISLIQSREKLIFKDKPMLLISAGPSLDGYIEWIQQHQKKFVIVCVDVIVRKLEKHNIVPDVVYSIDPSHKCAEFLTTHDSRFLDNSILAFMSQTAPETYEITEGKHRFFTQGLAVISQLGFFGSSPNVGTFSLLASVLMGANELYTIGNDAAFHQDTGHRYAQDSAHFIVDDHNRKVHDDRVYNAEDVVEVKGNLRETIKTNKDLLGFRNDYEMTLFNLHESFEFKVYNLSDGVYIHGMEPLSMDQMDNKVKNWNEKEYDMLENFNSISEIIDLQEIDYSLSVEKINEIIAMVKRNKKIQYANADEFLASKLSLTVRIMESLKTENDYVFAGIFMKYYELSDIYINFVLNLRQKNLHTKKNLNLINKVWSDGTIKLFKDMKDCILPVVDKK